MTICDEGGTTHRIVLDWSGRASVVLRIPTPYCCALARVALSSRVPQRRGVCARVRERVGAETWSPPLPRANLLPCGLLLCSSLMGCTQQLSFSDRASHAAIQETRALAADIPGPIAIEWNPATFPERIDKQGPSGPEGAATSAYIPTGVAISHRVDELLDVAVGTDRSAARVLTISVLEAESDYRYAIGVITSRHLEWGSCTVEAEFALGSTRWRERFSAQSRYQPSIDGDKGTGVLDRVWDDVAMQITRSVLARDWTPDATTEITPIPMRTSSEPDPRLQRVIDAWPQLSDTVRSRINGIVEGAVLSRDE